MEEPKIKIKAWCPTLHPKEREEDMDALKGLYSSLESRLEGIEFDMDQTECNKIIITIEAREPYGDNE